MYVFLEIEIEEIDRESECGECGKAYGVLPIVKCMGRPVHTFYYGVLVKCTGSDFGINVLRGPQGSECSTWVYVWASNIPSIHLSMGSTFNNKYIRMGLNIGPRLLVHTFYYGPLSKMYGL